MRKELIVLVLFTLIQNSEVMYRLLLFWFICLVSCQEKEKTDYLNFNPPQRQFVNNFSNTNVTDLDKYCVEENSEIANRPQGTYSNKRGISGGATLTIKEDNIFEYTFQGCLGNSHSKGHWMQSENRIILNSYPEYERNFDYPHSIPKAHRNYKEIQKTEIVNWELKVGEDFLLSERMGNSTTINVYKKIK